MGNDSRSTLKIYEPHLELHSEVDHALHGKVKVFYSKALPMTFLMRISRITQNSRLYNMFQEIQDRDNSCLLTLYGFKIQRQQGCIACFSGDRTVQYWEFLNYSLLDHIYDRQKRKAYFTYHQVWHVIQVVLTSLVMLQEHSLLWKMHPNQLLVTPEGKLKADWSHLTLQEPIQSSHTQFEGWLAPEERIPFFERNKFTLEKSNIYRLGLLILSMSSLTAPPSRFKTAWQQLLKWQQPIPSMVNRCLQQDPTIRPTASQLYQELASNFNPAYEILISQGRREDLQELQLRAQMLAEHSRGSNRFSELKEGSRYSQTGPLNFSYMQGRVDTTHESYDQRLQVLRQYRRQLAMSRVNNS